MPRTATVSVCMFVCVSVCPRISTISSATADGLRDDTIRCDTRCYFNVRSEADVRQLNLPHGTDN